MNGISSVNAFIFEIGALRPVKKRRLGEYKRQTYGTKLLLRDKRYKRRLSRFWVR